MSASSTRVILVAVLALVAGIVAFASAPAPPSRPPVAVDAGDYFTPEEIARAQAYSRTRLPLRFTGMGLGLAIGALLGLGLGTRRLGAWADRLTGGRWALTALVLVAVVVLVPALLRFPLAVLAWRQDRSYGLATNSFAGFATDVGKGLVFSLVISAVTALVFVGLARALPRAWPVAAAVAGIGLTVVMVYLFPLVYEPAFNRFDQAPPAVRTRVLALADTAGVRVNDVLVADASRRTTRLNAYVSGLGGTKRVVLYDTLLARAEPRTVDVVVAHELAHDAHRDVLRSTILSCVGVVVGVLGLWVVLSLPGLRAWIGVSGPGDARVVPFLAFAVAVATLATAPLQNAISRRVEAAADRAAVAMTRDPAAAVDLEVALARANLSDPTPNAFVVWAFYTHPPVLDRIEIALAEGRAAGLPVARPTPGGD